MDPREAGILCTPAVLFDILGGLIILLGIPVMVTLVLL